ncbi:MAG: ATP-binding protein [bacterium]
MTESTLQAWLQAQLFELVPCNIAVIDRNYNIVMHNRNFEGLFGPSRGRPCYAAYKKQERRCETCMAAQTFADGKVRVNDEVGVDKQGRTAYYLVHIVPIADADGQIPYIIEMSTDITEVKRLQREYQILFERVPCFVVVLNREFRVVRANQHTKSTFGATTGQYCWEVFKRRTEKCEDCPAELTFRDGQSHTCEQEGVSKRGESTHYVVTTSPLLRRDSTTHVVEMAVDVTRVHQLEQEKLEAERLAAVGQTVAGLAHGIKNILTGLEGGVYVFKSGLDRNDRVRLDQGWQMLDRNIEKISTLAKNLLSFSKGRVPEVRMVDPGELVQEVVDLYRDAALQQEIVVAADIRGPLSPAPFDPEAIHTCLANLVSNAMDACQMSEKPNCRVTVRCLEEEDSILFEVEDEGCGLDYDLKQKVFTNFFTTKGDGGTGLGLLLTRKITQEHGGRITMESAPGRGSTFRLLFPRNRLPKPAADVGAAGPLDASLLRDGGMGKEQGRHS